MARTTLTLDAAEYVVGSDTVVATVVVEGERKSLVFCIRSPDGTARCLCPIHEIVMTADALTAMGGSSCTA